MAHEKTSLIDLYDMIDNSVNEQINNLMKFKDNIKKIKDSSDVFKCIFEQNDDCNVELEKIIVDCKKNEDYHYYHVTNRFSCIGNTEIHKLSKYINNTYLDHRTSITNIQEKLNKHFHEIYDRSNKQRIMNLLYAIFPTEIIELIFSYAHQKMRLLFKDYIPRLLYSIEYDDLSKINLSDMKFVKYLSVSGDITISRNIDKFVNYLPNLVSLTGSLRVSDETITNLINLETLDTHYRDVHYGRTLYSGYIIPSFTDKGLKNCVNLTSLNCSNTIITDASLQLLTKLTNLNCSRTKITDTGLKSLTNLTNLDCSDCIEITDAGLKLLTNLTILNCSNCKKITNNSIQMLTKLTKLYCSYCTKISDACIQNMDNLTSLICKGCPKIKRPTRDKILQKNK